MNRGKILGVYGGTESKFSNEKGRKRGKGDERKERGKGRERRKKRKD